MKTRTKAMIQQARVIHIISPYGDDDQTRNNCQQSKFNDLSCDLGCWQKKDTLIFEWEIFDHSEADMQVPVINLVTSSDKVFELECLILPK